MGIERMMRDIDPEVVERGRRERAEYAARLGTPKRCKSGYVDALGGCLFCGADQGVSCRSRN